MKIPSRSHNPSTRIHPLLQFHHMMSLLTGEIDQGTCNLFRSMAPVNRLDHLRHSAIRGRFQAQLDLRLFPFHRCRWISLSSQQIMPSNLMASKSCMTLTIRQLPRRMTSITVETSLEALPSMGLIYLLWTQVSKMRYCLGRCRMVRFNSAKHYQQYLHNSICL